MNTPNTLGLTRDAPSAWNAFPIRVVSVCNGTVTANPIIERAILDLLLSGIERSESEIACCLLSSLAASHDEIFRDICIAKIDHLIEYGRGFGSLKITENGVERLEELIYKDRTRSVRLVADATLNNILAEMDLPS